MKALACLLICLGPVSPAGAVDWTWHGGLKNESAYFIAGDTRWDKIQNRLELKPEALFAGDWQFRGRVLAWYDLAGDLQSTRAPDLTPAIKSAYRSRTDLKEAYLLREGEGGDLRIGWQQVVWGKTDGLRLLDIVNPLDMSEFILDDFLDSRIGLFMLRYNHYPDSATEQEIEFLVIPDARPGRAAPEGARWALRRPSPPPGLVVATLPTERPHAAVDDTEFGLAWRVTAGGWDLSANVFHGWNDRPNAFRRITGGRMELQLRHLQMQTVGGSFSNAFGPWVVRGELAVNLREGIDTTTMASFADSVARRTTVNAALALEWTRYNWTISGQLFERHVSDWRADMLEERDSGFWTIRLATDFLHERLKPEMLFIADWADGGWLWRPRLAYEYSDALVFTLGADLFGGSRGSFFGQFAVNDRLALETEWTF